MIPMASSSSWPSAIRDVIALPFIERRYCKRWLFKISMVFVDAGQAPSEIIQTYTKFVGLGMYRLSLRFLLGFCS